MTARHRYMIGILATAVVIVVVTFAVKSHFFNISTATPTETDYEVQARTLNLSGKYTEALAAANTAISLDSNDMEAWIDRAEALYELGDCPNAVAAMYHVSMRNYHNPFVNEYMAAIMNSEECKKLEGTTS